MPILALSFLRSMGRVRHVHVAADDDRLFLAQVVEVLAESVLELPCGSQCAQVALGVRRVDRDEVEVQVFRGDDAALGVDLLSGRCRT